MSTRKQMFEAARKPPRSDMVPATVSFKIDRKKGELRHQSPVEKMLCALRKVLTIMSDKNEHGCRYYVDNNQVQVTKWPTGTSTKPGGPKSYTAAGRFKAGVCHPEGHKSSTIIEFNVSFRDVKDDRGLNDVEFFDPTTIDELPRNTPIDISALL